MQLLCTPEIILHTRVENGAAIAEKGMNSFLELLEAIRPELETHGKTKTSESEHLATGCEAIHALWQ